MYYFAYGSNMNQGQMRTRCPDSKFIGIGILKNYRLDFTISDPDYWGGRGCADVVSDPGAKVWGAVYEVSKNDIENLDRAEGEEYQRFLASILMDNKVVEADVYEVVNKAPFKSPSLAYIGVIKQAASEYGFPESYQAFLDSVSVMP